MTTRFPSIPELQIVGVFDHGVPNQERIVLRVHGHVQLGGYILAIGLVQQATETFLPIHDLVFWLSSFNPSPSASPGTTLIIYTGKGTDLITQLADGSGTAFVMHWGRANVVWRPQDASLAAPLLFRLDALGFPPNLFTTHALPAARKRLGP